LPAVGVLDFCTISAEIISVMMVVRALLTAFEQAIEIQSQYAKKAYDTWVAEQSKLSEMYVCMARDAYKPVEQAFAKRAPKTASVS
jgi:hypothetical protein